MRVPIATFVCKVCAPVVVNGIFYALIVCHLALIGTLIGMCMALYYKYTGLFSALTVFPQNLAAPRNHTTLEILVHVSDNSSQ